MLKLFKNSGLLALCLVISSNVLAETTEAPTPKPVNDDDIAYFFGYRFGNALLEGGNGDVNLDVLLKGMKDSLERSEPALDQERQGLVIREIQGRRVQQLADLAESFMAENAKQEGIVQTASGLQYQVLEPGGGKAPTADNEVLVHYEGRLINDQIFDSSIQRGEPVKFPLNSVIAGWTEGLQLMKEGGKTRFFIPPSLGYGPGGTGNIPPYAVLVFDVQLIEVTDPAQATVPSEG